MHYKVYIMNNPIKMQFHYYYYFIHKYIHMNTGPNCRENSCGNPEGAIADCMTGLRVPTRAVGYNHEDFLFQRWLSGFKMLS